MRVCPAEINKHTTLDDSRKLLLLPMIKSRTFPLLEVKGEVGSLSRPSFEPNRGDREIILIRGTKSGVIGILA